MSNLLPFLHIVSEPYLRMALNGQITAITDSSFVPFLPDQLRKNKEYVFLYMVYINKGFCLFAKGL